MAFNTIFSKNNQITVLEAKELIQNGTPVNMVMPLWIGVQEDPEWLFPIEPLVSISGQNRIVRRNVAKSGYRGTIKERWSEDDISISIQGAFVHSDLITYPSDPIQDLMFYIRQNKPLYVKNELLQLLNVRMIVIERYSFPFSKGENVQNFSIDAISDDRYDLFVRMKEDV